LSKARCHVSSDLPRREVICRIGDRSGNIASQIGDHAQEVFRLVSDTMAPT
jgi:hypothetical protein